MTPGEFGLNHAEGQFLGRYLTLPERMAPEFLTRQLRLYQAYDALLPVFAAASMEFAPETRKAAADFAILFAQVAEAPLIPYYDAIGNGFFTWLARARS